MTNTDSFDEAIIIALGSNLAGSCASSEAALDAALARLPSLTATVLQCSSYWRSMAWPDPAQPPFINSVAVVRTPLPPRALLAALLGLEAAFGRIRGPPNAPRALDVDLVAYGREILSAPGIVVPHPRAAERRFVMGPLAEIAPAWRHPQSGRTAAELAKSAVVGRDARPL
ncbi:MAG: 2-amino-4-hydroxy-6-hydroxymethyldihydropteridine diphosphokinase [Caulobacteraceae bacterium]